MIDLYTEQLEMQLRFAEEQSQAREMAAYEQGKADGIDRFAKWLDNNINIGIYDYNGNKISAIELLGEW